MLRRILKTLFATSSPELERMAPLPRFTPTKSAADRNALYDAYKSRCGRADGNCQCQTAAECILPAPSAQDDIRSDYIKTGRGLAMMIDAEFIVWRKGQRGYPIPSLDLYDPRRSLSWDVMKQNHIAIRPLTDADRLLSFEAIVTKYPCPAESEFND